MGVCVLGLCIGVYALRSVHWGLYVGALESVHCSLCIGVCALGSVHWGLCVGVCTLGCWSLYMGGSVYWSCALESMH